MAKAIDRIEFRAEPEQAELIRYAAALAHVSVSAFVVDAASRRAHELIQDQQLTVVPSEYFDKLLDALDEAPAAEANEPLARAAKRRQSEVSAGRR